MRLQIAPRSDPHLDHMRRQRSSQVIEHTREIVVEQKLPEEALRTINDLQRRLSDLAAAPREVHHDHTHEVETLPPQVVELMAAMAQEIKDLHSEVNMLRGVGVKLVELEQALEQMTQAASEQSAAMLRSIVGAVERAAQSEAKGK